MKFTWTRFGGYEVSTKGDSRFSALVARLEGRTIEAHYQCDVKGYQPGGINWKLGKGKPPLNPETDLYMSYLNLWRRWAKINPDLIADLRLKATQAHGVLSDCFASTGVSQARALSEILNESECQFPS